MKNGDIYFWSWKEEPKVGNLTDRYWCKSRKAIVIDGSLYDTYWGDRSHGWLDHETVELEFKGNVNDFVKSSNFEYIYYAPKDLIDMRHSNDTNGTVWIRKGAQRSKIVMMERAIEKLEDAERALRYAKNDVEKWTNKIKEIDAAEDLTKVWL